jgi:hypothetical protein
MQLNADFLIQIDPVKVIHVVLTLNNFLNGLWLVAGGCFSNGYCQEGYRLRVF